MCVCVCVCVCDILSFEDITRARKLYFLALVSLDPG